jgi:hypothetical protein
VLTLYGVAVTAENARHIVASLFADGSPAAMSAAAMIQKGVDRDLYAVALEPEERGFDPGCARGSARRPGGFARRARQGSPRARLVAASGGHWGDIQPTSLSC